MFRPSALFPTRAGKALAILTLVALASSLVATLAYAFGLLTTRPLLYGEAEVVYEASRLKANLPLYTDPIAGDFAFGAPPSRVFVTYPPLWSWALSWMRGLPIDVGARVLGTLGWFGLLAWIARVVAAKGARRRATVAAAYVAGIYVLVLWASSGRPDTPAVALAAAALARSARRSRVDSVAAALFTVAIWTKPNVVGMALGAFAVQMIQDRRGFAKAALVALAVSAAIGGTLYTESHGAFVVHLRASLGQPLSAALWAQQMSARTAFAIPLALTGIVAWRSRRDPIARFAAAGFVGSLLSAAFALAKLGSASNYWIEPGAAAVLLYAVAPAAALSDALGARLAIAVAAVWQSVATLGSVVTDFRAEPKRAEFVRSAVAECKATTNDVVLADDPGLELSMNGRIVAPAFQMDHLVRSGRFPLAVWEAEMTGPGTPCLLTHGPLDPPEIDDLTNERYPPELRRALLAHFAPVRDEEGLVLYRLR